MPIEFVLFALTLAGVALFHHRTLQVALTGLLVVVLYKLVFTGFKTGAGFAGLALHLQHEWVILANLFGLLMGFALLSKHFEESNVPAVLPRFLPDDATGGFALLAIVFVLSGFLDNIAAALIGGTMARVVFAGKVHLGYLAGIVAAANAGGAGSVLGDTTTTMMWIAGVSPFDVLHAYVPAIVALIVFGIPAALQQQRHSPIVRNAPVGAVVDWMRVAIVAFILAAAIVANVAANTLFPSVPGRVPLLGLTVWAALLLSAPLRKPDWSLLPETFKGTLFLLSLVTIASLMPVEALPPGVLAQRVGHRFRLGGLRQHSADGARAESRRLRLGHARVRGRLRRLDDLVRFERRRRGVESCSPKRNRSVAGSPPDGTSRSHT